MTVLVPNFRECAPLTLVLGALAGGERTAAQVAGELGVRVRLVVVALNMLAGEGRVSRFVGCVEPEDGGEWRSLPAVWRLT